jgi:hypothetical protein
MTTAAAIATNKTNNNNDNNTNSSSSDNNKNDKRSEVTRTPSKKAEECLKQNSYTSLSASLPRIVQTLEVFMEDSSICR